MKSSTRAPSGFCFCSCGFNRRGFWVFGFFCGWGRSRYTTENLTIKVSEQAGVRHCEIKLVKSIQRYWYN
ncbi:MAG: hypothetical protein P2A85_06200 [Microcoleus anatoxicus]|uniref:hypothetical protein n=1 Tax=Microcoleus anatoxicus TaxID=2705319 RepID=UPI00366DEC9C